MKHGGAGKRRLLLTADEKTEANNNKLAGLTLLAVLGGGGEEMTSPTAAAQQTRTLLNVIRDDPNGSKENRKTWRHFKEKLKMKKDGPGGVGGAAWTSTVPIPASDVPIHGSNSRAMSRRLSTRFPSGSSDAEYPADEYKPEFGVSQSRRELRSTPSSRMMQRNQSRAAAERSLKLQSSMSIRRKFGEDEEGGEGEEEGSGDDDSEEGGGGGGGGDEGDQPQRMSLMALLAESEGGYTMDEEEEEEDGGGCEEYGGEYHNCCVCMVRHRGEVFEPCGHTFCRLCSRELWAEKGNCPLCNNFILEILDIF